MSEIKEAAPKGVEKSKRQRKVKAKIAFLEQIINHLVQQCFTLYKMPALSNVEETTVVFKFFAYIQVRIRIFYFVYPF